MSEPAPAIQYAYDDVVAIAKAVGDATRAQILRVLARDSFGVLELADIVGLAQPALSHHLKLLLNVGLVTKRREGNSLFYRRALSAAHGDLAAYVDSVFAALDALPLDAGIHQRIERVHRRRSAASRAFFRANAEDFANQQALISGADVYAGAVMEQLTGTSGRALEIGPGVGTLLPLLAARFEAVDAIDDAAEMLARARATVTAAGVGNVALIERAFEALTDRVRYDAIVAGMVVHHSPSPARFFRHAATLLAVGGRFVVVELARHDQEWVKDACGDVWLGFAEDELDAWAAAAHLTPGPSQYLAQKNGFCIQIKTYSKES